MKTIGMIGGMSWESSLEYYRIINETVRHKLGGLHSAKCLLYSVDFAGIERFQKEGRWEEAAAVMEKAAKSLEKGGADFVIICTNTMHKLADAVEKNVSIPLLHIADPTGELILEKKADPIALLGTRFTMEEPFYKQRLEEKFGLEVIIPDLSDRNLIHKVIYDELCLGKINPPSKTGYLEIIDRLAAKGAKGVILGCTEIGLLVKQADCDLPLFDTTFIHARAAVAHAIDTGD